MQQQPQLRMAPTISRMAARTISRMDMDMDMDMVLVCMGMVIMESLSMGSIMGLVIMESLESVGSENTY